MNNDDDDQALQKKQMHTTRPRQLSRVSGPEAIAAKEICLLALLVVEPEHQTQRRLFRSLLPTLYMLRNKDGYTFKQITSLLRDSGIKLVESSVRAYYFKMLPSLEDECIIKMKEWTLLRDELRKRANEMEISSSSEKALEILEVKRIKDDF